MGEGEGEGAGAGDAESDESDEIEVRCRAAAVLVAAVLVFFLRGDEGESEAVVDDAADGDDEFDSEDGIRTFVRALFLWNLPPRTSSSMNSAWSPQMPCMLAHLNDWGGSISWGTCPPADFRVSLACFGEGRDRRL